MAACGRPSACLERHSLARGWVRGLHQKNGGLRTRIWAGRWEEKEARCFKEEMKKGWNQSRGRGREDWMNVKRGVGRVGTGSVGSLLFHKPTCTTQFEDNAVGSYASIRTPLSYHCMYEHLHKILTKCYNESRKYTFLLSFAVCGSHFKLHMCIS